MKLAFALFCACVAAATAQPFFVAQEVVDDATGKTVPLNGHDYNENNDYVPDRYDHNRDGKVDAGVHAFNYGYAPVYRYGHGYGHGYGPAYGLGYGPGYRYRSGYYY